MAALHPGKTKRTGTQVQIGILYRPRLDLAGLAMGYSLVPELVLSNLGPAIEDVTVRLSVESFLMSDRRTFTLAGGETLRLQPDDLPWVTLDLQAAVDASPQRDRTVPLVVELNDRQLTFPLDILPPDAWVHRIHYDASQRGYTFETETSFRHVEVDLSGARLRPDTEVRRGEDRHPLARLGAFVRGDTPDIQQLVPRVRERLQQFSTEYAEIVDFAYGSKEQRMTLMRAIYEVAGEQLRHAFRHDPPPSHHPDTQRTRMLKRDGHTGPLCCHDTVIHVLSLMEACSLPGLYLLLELRPDDMSPLGLHAVLAATDSSEAYTLLNDLAAGTNWDHIKQRLFVVDVHGFADGMDFDTVHIADGSMLSHDRRVLGYAAPEKIRSHLGGSPLPFPIQPDSAAERWRLDRHGLAFTIGVLVCAVCSAGLQQVGETGRPSSPLAPAVGAPSALHRRSPSPGLIRNHQDSGGGAIAHPTSDPDLELSEDEDQRWLRMGEPGELEEPVAETETPHTRSGAHWNDSGGPSYEPAVGAFQYEPPGDAGVGAEAVQ